MLSCLSSLIEGFMMCLNSSKRQDLYRQRTELRERRLSAVVKTKKVSFTAILLSITSSPHTISSFHTTLTPPTTLSPPSSTLSPPLPHPPPCLPLLPHPPTTLSSPLHTTHHPLSPFTPPSFPPRVSQCFYNR